MIFAIAVTPPAQLTVILPSSSESRFIMYLPSKTLPSKFIAPSMLTSSFTVNNTSNFGVAISPDAKRASPIATAIPLSAPSVVPFA